MTTNERLRQIKDEQALTQQDIAELLEPCSLSTVKAWLSDKDGIHWRRLPEHKLKLLEVVLGLRK